MGEMSTRTLPGALVCAIVLLGCGESDEAASSERGATEAEAPPATEQPAPPVLGPCLPVLWDHCGFCLGGCEQSRELEPGVYETSAEAIPGRRPYGPMTLEEHCLGEDCRQVYLQIYPNRNCYGMCASEFEGWPECAMQEDRCVTLNPPEPRP